jgi:exodeoxyribonuclease VII small subunit
MAKASTYQELYLELESIVSELQSMDTDLDDTVKKYERGIEIIDELQKQLKTAENRITRVKKLKS